MSETKPKDKLPEKEQVKQPKPTSNKFSNVIWWGMIIVFALIPTSWFWQQQNLSGHEQKMQQRLAAVTEMQQQLSSEMAEQRASVDAMQTQFSQLQRQMIADNDAWILAEIEYLTRLADQRSHVDHDATMALNLLKAAQQRSQKLTDPALRTMKQALANGISGLEAVPTVDVEKIITRLNALSNTLGELPLSDTYADVEKINQEQPSDLPVWKQQLQKNIKRLESVVMIRHLDKPSQALLPPQQHASLVENIQLQLSMAQWAALNYSATVFQQSLDQAILWIQKYLRETTATGAIVQGLKQLKAIDVEPHLPSLALVVKRVQQAIAADQAEARTMPKPMVPSQPPQPHQNNHNDEVQSAPADNGQQKVDKPRQREIQVISS